MSLDAFLLPKARIPNAGRKKTNSQGKKVH